jgi:putative SOS response-associated peptidase YedK
MCGRFTLFSDISDLSERFGFTTVIEQLKPSYNVSPSQQVLVVTENEGNTQAEFMKWGLIPNWAVGESSKSNFINARLETANLKASFSAAFRYRRCLIIANGFYEWDRSYKHPKPYYYQFEHGRPFAFAGIWENATGSQTNTVKSCSIITKKASSPVLSIHGRMPAIVPSENECQWKNNVLNKDSEIKHLLHSSSPQTLEGWTVSNLINSWRNNNQQCISRV